jgi:hypothetical protein
MFNFDNLSQDDALDRVIDDVLSDLRDRFTSDSEEYSDAADNLIKLMKLKKEINPSWRPSPDALVGAIGSISGILLILNFEKLGVITSKALTFVGKSLR